MNYSVAKIFLHVAIIILSGYRLYAQTISASPYSVYGVGMLKDKTSALNRSLSGTGIGIRDPLNLNNLNPASYPSVQTVTQIFELGLFIESDYYKTTQQSSKFSTGNLTSINYWFRFSKNWAGTFGLAPFSNVEYNVTSSNNLGEEGGSTVQYSGSGGISQFYFGNGYQITKNLALGINTSYIFGSIEKNETINSGLGSGTGLTNKISVHRLNADFGAQYTFFLRKNRTLSVGFTYDDELHLNTSDDIVVFESFEEDTLWTQSTNVDDYVLPAQLGVGISFQTPRSTLAADVTFKEWSKAKLGDDVNLQNTLRFSFGYQYNGNPEAESYWGNIQLQSGFYVHDNYLVLGKTSFVDWGLSLGIGLPFNGNRGSVNFSYNYNQSGTTANNLIKQQANVLILDLTFRDLWGIRRKFD